MQLAQTIIPCLWFDNQAEGAAAFYTAIFKTPRIDGVTGHGKEGCEKIDQETLLQA